MKRPPLTKKREGWAEQRGGHTFKGTPLRYPAPVAERYKSQLDAMIERMSKEYEREMVALFNELGGELTQDASIASQARIRLNKLRNKWERFFSKRAPVIADNIIGQVDKYSASSLGASLKQLSGGLTLKTTVMPAALKEAVTASIAENVTLIKSIPQQYHTQIEGAVMRSIQPGGNGLQDVRAAVTERLGITKRRADMIATDQVRKATTSANSARAKALGIRKFQWLHSGGGAEPRKLHQELDGMTFSYDDLPVIDERTGERGLPGQLINCRCVAIPIVDFGGDDE